MATKDERDEWELPSVREIHQIPALKSDLYSVKFYPYTQPGVDPVFAMVGSTHILICRPPSEENGNSATEYLKFVFDQARSENHFACAWTKDLETNTPLLCVAGSNAKIQIIDALTGRLTRTLIGHGGEIEDLVVSPINPHILASASEDTTVRIWSLDPTHKDQPCAAILGGDGHREMVLTLAFHKSGRYLLSGGIDHIINLWTLPEFPDANTGTNTPTRIHYPHFSSPEVCLDVVDCIEFFGDLILSKPINDNIIVLWAINGFSSSLPPPPPSSAPTTHDIKRPTRSSFNAQTSTTSAGTISTAYYTRLLQLKIPTSEIMFTRFSLFPGLGESHPVLAFCNNAGKIFFWDFERFEQYYDWEDTEPPELAIDEAGNPIQNTSLASLSLEDKEPMKRPSFLTTVTRRSRGGKTYMPRAPFRRVRENSPTESSSSVQTGTDSGNANQVETNEKVDWKKTKKMWRSKYSLGDMLENKEPHKVVDITKNFALCGRQMAWSNDGQWCVAVGNDGVFVLLQRWAK